MISTDEEYLLVVDVQNARKVFRLDGWSKSLCPEGAAIGIDEEHLAV